MRQRADLFAYQYNKDTVFLWNKGSADLLAAPLKDWGFLRLGFLTCDTNPLHWRGPPGPLCIAPVEHGGKGYQHKYAKAHATCFAMSN